MDRSGGRLPQHTAPVVELPCVWEPESDESFIGEQDEWAEKAKTTGWKWTPTMEKTRKAKRFLNSKELMNEIPQDWDAQLATLEIGTWGMIATETKHDCHNILRTFGRQEDTKSCSGKCLTEARRRCMLGSYMVWVHRDREEWDLQETVGHRRGRTEVHNLAIVDLVRQREESEEDTRQGHGRTCTTKNQRKVRAQSSINWNGRSTRNREGKLRKTRKPKGCSVLTLMARDAGRSKNLVPFRGGAKPLALFNTTTRLPPFPPPPSKWFLDAELLHASTIGFSWVFFVIF